MKSKGLGDSVEKFTRLTGIKKFTEKVLGKNCNCEKRKDQLNKMFPY